MSYGNLWDPTTNKMKIFTYEVFGFKIGQKGCEEFILNEFFENIQK